MNLESFFEIKTDKNLGSFLVESEEVKIKSKIRQRRSQMLVHSCLYYDMDENLVDDHTWQKWADELTHLQEKYPEFCKINFFDREFSDWDGSTGHHLPLRHPYVRGKAEQLLKLQEKYGDV